MPNIRYEWGDLDLIAGALFLAGIYLIQIGRAETGWILIGLGILKQFSEK